MENIKYKQIGNIRIKKEISLIKIIVEKNDIEVVGEESSLPIIFGDCLVRGSFAGRHLSTFLKDESRVDYFTLDF